jgi:3-hydroxyisobutyrate dehydrogenase
MDFKHLGVVGLGNLGGTIAKLLTEDGTVHGYDPDPERCRVAAAGGVIIEPSPAALARNSDIVLLSLPQSDIVDAVCTGPEGIIASGKRGLLVVDTTSGYPATTIEVGAKLEAAGMRMIEATVTALEGGVPAALKRNLTLIVGGDEADVARARPLLERLASHIVYAGPLGSGQIVKLINNAVAAIQQIATTEGMLVAAKHGIDPEHVAEAMRYGTGYNAMVSAPGRLKALAEITTFSVGLMTKDLRQMSQLAAESHVPTFLGDLAFHMHEIFTQQLGYEAGVGQLRQVMEEWAGVKIEREKLAATRP